MFRAPLILLAAIALASFPVRADDSPALGFKPAGDRLFDFDTGTVKGKLRANGKYQGISSFVDVKTGKELTRGGIIRATGRWDDKTLSKVAAPARRGGTALMVDRPDRFKVGDEVRLALRDDANHSLTHHLYAGDPGDVDNLKGVRASWIARVVEVDRKTKRIVFDRSLRTDVRLEWQPVLHPARSTVEEIGIEHLAFEFPVTPYKGHFTELGYNAIAYSGVRNSWVRDIEIRHADSGMFLGGANTTVTGVVWTSDRKQNGDRNSTGHHGIALGGTDQLLSNFDFRTRFIHDITTSRGSAGNVVRAGRGEDLAFERNDGMMGKIGSIQPSESAVNPIIPAFPALPVWIDSSQPDRFVTRS